MYKAIIFDFFGVIQADPYPRWLNKHGFKREGEFAELSDTVDKSLITLPDFYERLGKLSGQSAQDVEMAFHENKTIDEELIKLIRLLKDKYRIGLLSNAPGEYLRPILKEHDIDGLFDVDIISSEAGFIKPDVRIFKLTLKKLSSKPEETVFIDDNAYNTEAAGSIGIKSFLYKDLATLKEELSALGINPE